MEPDGAVPVANHAPEQADARAAWAGAQHARGRLTAHERVALLLDAGSATGLGPDRGGDCGREDDGVVTMRGSVGGRPVCVFAKDMSVEQGTLGEAHARQICRLQELAIQSRAPIIGIFDSAGMRLEAGMAAVAGYGAIVRNSAAARGLVPQIALIVGGCTGADALLAPLSDFVFMANDDSFLFVSGPEVVKDVTHEELSAENLGGPGVHAATSSLADGTFDNDVEAIQQVRRLLAFLPSHSHAGVPAWECFDDADREGVALDTLVPDAETAGYNVKELIGQVSDEGDFFELHAAFAPNIVTALARIEGRTVGIVANQSAVLAGVLDADAASKAARFVCFCNAFAIPVVTFVDAPGFLPGIAQEHGGVARQAAGLLLAYARATVPLVTVVLRRAYGAAGGAMGSRSLGADRVYAWPGAKVGLLNASGAAARRGVSGDAAFERNYEEQVLSTSAVARSGAVDAVIVPRRTRLHVAQALRLLTEKPRCSPRS